MNRVLSVLVLAMLMGLVYGLGALSPSPVAAQAPQELVIGKSTDVPTWDPHSTGALHAEIVFANVYETLIARDSELKLKPGLAVSWRTVDPTTWELALRPGVRFHNGEPFTADTVKYSFERALDPTMKYSRVGLLRLIKAITIVDDLTVRFTTERPWPLFLQTIARHGWIVPKRYLEENGQATRGSCRQFTCWSGYEQGSVIDSEGG